MQNHFSDHFNNLCPDMEYLKIKSLEHDTMEMERDPRDFDRFDILNRSDIGLKRGQSVSVLKY